MLEDGFCKLTCDMCGEFEWVKPNGKTFLEFSVRNPLATDEDAWSNRRKVKHTCSECTLIIKRAFEARDNKK
jgi:hypothetical protein